MGPEPVNWWRTDLGESEIAALADAVRQGCLSQGDVTEALERQLGEWLGVPYVVVTTSGTVALMLALAACGVERGDEVIVPNRTFVATANAPLMLGATVRVVDVEPGRPLMDAVQLEAAITPKTKAVVPVHLNGRAADMDAIRAVAQQHGLRVVEDAAQALGSQHTGAFLGTLGDAGAFSMGVTKLITAGQGGFVVTHDPEVYAHARRLRNHGSGERTPVSYAAFGMNFKYTDLQAAVALAQFRGIDGKRERHRAVYRFYEAALAGIDGVRLIPVALDAGELPLWVEVLCRDRERVVAGLREHNIEGRKFLPGLNALAYLGCDGVFPNSTIYGEQGLILPCGPDQPGESLERTGAALRELRV